MEEGREELPVWFPSFFISGCITKYCGGETNGRNRWMLDNFGFQFSLYLHSLYDLLLVPMNTFPYVKVRAYSLELYIWCGKFALIHFHFQLN